MKKEAANEKIEITYEIVSKLKAEQRRTGLGPQAILRGTRNSRPKALNATLVKRWLSGVTKFGEKEHLTYIQNLWASFPDKAEVRLALTDSKRNTFRKALKETGLSINKLFSKRSDQPKGFNVKHVSAYFMPSRHKINREYYDYIIAVCKENKGKGYMPLTPEIQHLLQAEIDRTGLHPTAFIKEVKKHEDPKYNPTLLHSWLKGTVETLDKETLNEVLLKYAAFPDKVEKVTKSALKTEALQPIKESDLAKMKRYRDILGILPGKVFENATNIPPNLTKHIVSSWLSESTQNALPEHVQWVLNRCHELVLSALQIEN